VDRPFFGGDDGAYPVFSEIVDEMDSVADMQASARLQWNKRVQSLGIFEQDEDVEPGKSIRS